MPDLHDWDPSPLKTEPQRALEVNPIIGVMPFAGSRNPLTRSNIARRVSLTATTPHLNGIRQVFHLESGLECAVFQDVAMSPDLHHVEVQLPPIRYTGPTGETLGHWFDILVTKKSGHKIAIYVKNRSGLNSVRTQDEIHRIIKSTPISFADGIHVVSDNDYSKERQLNLMKIWPIFQKRQPDKLDTILKIATAKSFRTVSDLAKASGLPVNEAASAVYSLIGQKIISANWERPIIPESKIWL